jgi:hypothetical protein
MYKNIEVYFLCYRSESNEDYEIEGMSVVFLDVYDVRNALDTVFPVVFVTSGLPR